MSRRWLRFSLRAILILTVVVAVPLGWKVNHVSAERGAVAEIQQAGGHVKRRPFSWLPFSLYSYASNDWVSYVEVVILCEGDKHPLLYYANDGTFADRHLAAVARLPMANQVYIWSDHITDAGMNHLANAPKVLQLQLRGRQSLLAEGVESRSKITAAGIAHLARMPELRALSVGPSEAPLASFACLTSLNILDVSLPSVSAEDLESLVEHPNLRHLIVRCPPGPIPDLDWIGQVRRRLPALQILTIQIGELQFEWTHGSDQMKRTAVP